MNKKSYEKKKGCPCCKTIKNTIEFYPDISRKKGLNIYCKDCLKKKQEKYKEKLYSAEYARRKRERAPEKTKARTMITNALSLGKIKKGKYFLCGSEITKAHHLNYTFPMKVIWLCKKHHSKIHRQCRQELKFQIIRCGIKREEL